MAQKRHCDAAYLYVVGENQFQNEMLVENLKKLQHCKHSFTITTSLTKIPPDIWDITSHQVVIYLDCHCLENREVEALLDSACQIIQPGNMLVLFNLTKDSGIEKKALKYGVRGFLYADDSLEDFCRGTRSILKGEVWASRKIISEAILTGIRPPSRYYPQMVTDTPNLSPREKEVLRHLASGATNDVIAADLFISVHTLRTHLYHIYRKINVHNRIQASFWAEKNL